MITFTLISLETLLLLLFPSRVPEKCRAIAVSSDDGAKQTAGRSCHGNFIIVWRARLRARSARFMAIDQKLAEIGYSSFKFHDAWTALVACENLLRV